MKTVEDKFRKIIVEQMGVDPSEVTLTAKFVDDLGFDSLDAVEVIIELEEAFTIEIPDEDLDESKLQTFGDGVNYLKGRLKGKTL